MLKRLFKWATLVAALLLSLCVLDASFTSSRGGPASPALPPPAEFSLTLEAHGLGGGVTWEGQILREVRKVDDRRRVLRNYHVAQKVSATGAAPTTIRLEEGSYWLIARAPGLARATVFIDLHTDERKPVSFLPAASLEVTTFAQDDAALRPLAGATVLVGEPDELPLGGATDSEGRLKFVAVPKGPLRVRIFAPGYEPYEGMAERELVVQLRPTSILRVTVTERGVVQPDAQVFIAGANLWPARVVVTGDKGFIDISGLKPGRYALYAEKGVLVSKVAGDVEVLSKAGKIDVVLELEPGQFVQARVLARENEKPIEGARVTWSSVGLGQFSRHEVTDAEGIVRVGPLPRLEGVLSLRASGYVSRITPVEQPSEREDGGEFQITRLERSGTIEGRVLDPDGFPVAGATIEVAGTDMYSMPVSVTHLRDEISDAHFDWAEEQRNVLIPAGELGVMLGPVPPIPLSDVPASEGRLLTTNEKGYFIARDVPPGELVVLARHPAYMDGRSKIVNLGPGGKKSVEVVLGRGKPLRGRVLDDDDFPVPLARVQVTARGFDRRVTAEEDGTFVLEAAPEDVTLRVSRFERPLQILLASRVKKKERHEEIQLKLPAPRETARISIVDEDDEPVPLAQVTILSLDARVPLKNTRFSNDEGQVDFEEAATLRCRIEVTSPGHVKWVSERKLAEQNEVELTRALDAEGRVTAVRGRRAADGAVILFKSGTVTRRVVADEVGQYRLTGLPPGVGELSARHEEYGSAKARVRIRAGTNGRDMELPTLDLAPNVEISGVVVDDSGRPVAGAFVAADRIGPYLAPGAPVDVLAESDESGEFRVEVARDEPLYLYGAAAGRMFGFSDPISAGDLDRVEDVRIILDRPDKIPPDQRGTVLVALEESPAGIVLYSIGSGSHAERTGLRPDDLLVEVEGTRPRDVRDARDLLSGLPGSDVRLVIHRRGGNMELITSREAFRR